MQIPPGSEYVAMGSSFAAGPGLRPRSPGAPRASGRSDSNYAHVAAAHLGLALNDVTFSGATTTDILTASAGRSAQIDAVTARTRLVTLTAGGNDVGYLPALTLASLPWPVRDLARFRDRVAAVTDAATTDDRFGALTAGLTTIVSEVQRRAPDARVVLVDYLTILPPDDASGRGPDVLRRHRGGDLVEWGRGVATRLTETFASVAAAEGCDLLDVGARSRHHDAWSAEPWTRRFHLTLRGGAPFHPSASGMAAVAQMLIERIR
ncbi:SGNH/GDSL hydrolase family protein [Herbiconiux daphne]|uniref:SGNH/GDSL hydrolase family protein n=1 Tax=Herbiconiux daphne TaxID=2970914 RepID=A0ABT2H510_9MICO|nr:SGNH/GDSL hydrolase family protein [Herbiconiux daphne]MCS5735027.1 SGNH/GDSL hydrolase family protein [Herbiconiux daphne]